MPIKTVFTVFKPSVIIKSLLVISSMVFSYHVAAKDSDPLITSFNDSSIGVAFTMLSEDSWKQPGAQNFHSTPSDPQQTVQAVTISNSSKEIWPYPADSRYGLIFSIDDTSDFYQYFATKSAFTTSCKAGDAKFVTPITDAPGYDPKNSITNWAVSCNNEQIAFCGRCSDGGICAGSGIKPIPATGGWPALGDQVSYDQFNKAKNSIVAKTGVSCPWINTANEWNEFDTNGLSPSALKGVIIDGITPGSDRSWVPSHDILCAYFDSVGSSNETWNKYKLTSAGPKTGKSVLTNVGNFTCK